MRLARLPYNASLADYVKQADALFAGWQAGDEKAVSLFRAKHPKFLDAKIPWLERHLTDQEVRATPITRQDASLALARWYDFADWQRLTEYVEAVTTPGSPVACFEAAVEAVIDGDIATLTKLLREDPALVRARSTRMTHFDPPVHGAMLLHYLAANGVEGYRQRSPKNAAEVAKVLLEAGADPNALCSLYGSQCTTMALLVSSTPPDQAGVQVALVDVLVDYGASIAPAGEGNWTSPSRPHWSSANMRRPRHSLGAGRRSTLSPPPLASDASMTYGGCCPRRARKIVIAHSRSPRSSVTLTSSACCSMRVRIRTVSTPRHR